MNAADLSAVSIHTLLENHVLVRQNLSVSQGIANCAAKNFISLVKK